MKDVGMKDVAMKDVAMKYGAVLPNVGGMGDARLLAELSREAEDSGWDGVFVFDSIYSRDWDRFFAETAPEKRGVADPWIALTAMALATERIRLGPMITPVTRRRPWKLARECVTLDHLSNGRLVLPVGLGSVEDGGFEKVGEELDRKKRAERLDEGLAILAGLWSGEPFTFRGKHFAIDDFTHLPKALQSPRIPVWVVALWPYPKSIARALRWDGACPARREGEFTPEDTRELAERAAKERGSDAPFDIVIEGETSGGDLERARSRVRPFAEAGATWWLESVWMRAFKPPEGIERVRLRLKQGPPRVD